MQDDTIFTFLLITGTSITSELCFVHEHGQLQKKSSSYFCNIILLHNAFKFDAPSNNNITATQYRQLFGTVRVSDHDTKEHQLQQRHAYCV